MTLLDRIKEDRVIARSKFNIDKNKINSIIINKCLEHNFWEDKNVSLIIIKFLLEIESYKVKLEEQKCDQYLLEEVENDLKLIFGYFPEVISEDLENYLCLQLSIDANELEAILKRFKNDIQK